jgi:hypothetical protein
MLADLQKRNTAANTSACGDGGSDGAGVVQSSVRDSKAKTVVLNIWDFAGQAVYYTTHQVNKMGSRREGRN